MLASAGFWITVVVLGLISVLVSTESKSQKSKLDRIRARKRHQDQVTNEATPAEDHETFIEPQNTNTLEYPYYYTRFDPVDFGPNWHRIYTDVEVAGIHHKRQETDAFIIDLEDFFFECHCFLALIRDPENKFDQNAIRVIAAVQTEEDGTKQHHIGYVPRNLAAAISRKHSDEVQLAGKPILIKASGDHVDFSFDLFAKIG